MTTTNTRPLVLLFTTEPLPAEHPFWATEGITVLPHIGGLAAGDGGPRHRVLSARGQELR
jgi:hypothetical protein